MPSIREKYLIDELNQLRFKIQAANELVKRSADELLRRKRREIKIVVAWIASAMFAFGIGNICGHYGWFV